MDDRGRPPEARRVGDRGAGRGDRAAERPDELAEPVRPGLFGDLDGDGDIDIVVGERGGPIRVLENDGARGPWLIVELADSRPGVGNRHALGSRVVLRQGGTVQTRWIFSGGSFQSASAAYAHFGLPAQDEASLDITWSDGVTQKLEHVKLNQHLVVERLGRTTVP